MSRAEGLVYLPRRLDQEIQALEYEASAPARWQTGGFFPLAQVSMTKFSPSEL